MVSYAFIILKYELLVDSRPNEVVIALLKDKKLIELHKEPVGTKFSVGDVFLAKVKKIITGLNATFVDVGDSNSRPNIK